MTEGCDHRPSSNACQKYATCGQRPLTSPKREVLGHAKNQPLLYTTSHMMQGDMTWSKKINSGGGLTTTTIDQTASNYQ